MATFPTEFDQLKRRFEKDLTLTIEKLDGPSLLQESICHTLFSESKRLRPLFCLKVSEILGGSLIQTMPAAMAIELVHTYSLIHDDLPSMDNAALRRGRAASHIQFSEAVAILAGDALLTLAFHLLSDPQWSLDPTVKLSIIRELSKAAGMDGMVGGQVADIQSKSSPSLTLENAIEIYRQKTAKLFEAACVMGGLCAGADAMMLGYLRRYGESIGLAFQATDDMVDGDLNGVPRETMKPIIERWIIEAKESMDRIKPTEGAILKDFADWILHRSQ